MPPAKTVTRALLPFALHSLAREVDAALGLVLHASLTLPSPGGETLALLDGSRVAARVAASLLLGAVVWVVVARLGARGLAEEAGGFAVLYLRPVLTALALISVALVPAYPYAFTLPVALTQDWGPAQDAAALAVWLALRRPGWRLPAPRAGEVFFIAFLLYALVTPERARHWDNHPGNEPKTLRMAVALGHGHGLDVEGVTTAMEALPVRPLGTAAGQAAAVVLGESGRMAGALMRGEAGASAIQATRITRQTVRGKEGGVYHVLAPGVSALLAPALRVDRALNRARGTPGRLAVTVLWWNALAAALVAALFQLARDATGRPGLCAALALGFALAPPFLCYSFQFYPEMVGALGLALAFRRLVSPERLTARTAWLLGLGLAALPWWHQKFLPVWLVLLATAAVAAWKQKAPRPVGLALLVPQAASLYLIALWNFAITGSVRPDALYLAWGPQGVATERVGQGLLGLLLDARYGILPYAPVYLLGFAGLGRFRVVLPAALVYYLTVASADNWSGAVCNLGRYVMPVLPLLVAGAAVVLSPLRRGVVALFLVLAAWTALLTRALWLDPHAANDSALLLAKAVLADGNLYLPNLFIKTWAEGAPGLGARIVVWVLLGLLLAIWLRRGRGESLLRVLVGTAGVLMASAFFLERWPPARSAPNFAPQVEVAPGTTVFLPEVARLDRGGIVLPAGSHELLVRSSSAGLWSLPAVIGGDGLLRVAERTLVVRPTGASFAVPLVPIRTFRDASGRQEVLCRQRLEVEGAVILRLRENPGEPGGTEDR